MLKKELETENTNLKLEIKRLSKLLMTYRVCKKKNHETELDATKNLKWLKSNGIMENGSIYKCNTCEFWHITSASKRQQRIFNAIKRNSEI